MWIECEETTNGGHTFGRVANPRVGEAFLDMVRYHPLVEAAGVALWHVDTEKTMMMDTKNIVARAEELSELGFAPVSPELFRRVVLDVAATPCKAQEAIDTPPIMRRKLGEENMSTPQYLRRRFEEHT